MGVLEIVLPLASVLLGGLITYGVNVRSRRETYRGDLINDAIGRLAAAAASVNFIATVRRSEHQSEEDFAELQRWLVMTSMKNWATKVAEANEALARVVPYCPELADLLPLTIDSSHPDAHHEPTAMLRSLQRPASARRLGRSGAGGPARPAT